MRIGLIIRSSLATEFAAISLDLPEVEAAGRSLDEVHAAAREAAQRALEARRERGGRPALARLRTGTELAALGSEYGAAFVGVLFVDVEA
jgi:predicted RNase H-like HicB family nuclease